MNAPTENGLDVAETLAELRSALETRIDASEITDLIDDRLIELRWHYRKHHNEFSDDGIRFLRSLRRVRGALDSLDEVLYEVREVRTQGHAQEVIARLFWIEDQLVPYRVAIHAKEAREKLLRVAEHLPNFLPGDASRFL